MKFNRVTLFLIFCTLIMLPYSFVQVFASEEVKREDGSLSHETAAPIDDSTASSSNTIRKIQKYPTPDLSWKDDTQKSLCQSYLLKLNAHLVQLRRNYIKGKPCECADQSTRFLVVVQKCRQDCPDGMLESTGYSRRVIRNVNWLKDLNTKRCELVKSMQSKSENPSEEKAKSDAPVDSEPDNHQSTSE